MLEHKAESLTKKRKKQSKPCRPAFHSSGFLLHFNTEHCTTDGATATMVSLLEQLKEEPVTVKKQELLLGAAEQGM